VPISVDGSRRRARVGSADWSGRFSSRVVEEIAVLAGGRLRPDTVERLRTLTSGGYDMFLAVLEGQDEAGSPAAMGELVGDLFEGFDISLEDAMALHRHLEQVLLAEAKGAGPFASTEPDVLEAVAHRFFNDLAAALTDAFLASRRADDRDRDAAEHELVGCLLATPPRLGEARRLARSLDVDLEGSWEVAIVASLDDAVPVPDAAITMIRRGLRGAAILVGHCDLGVVIAVRPGGPPAEWPDMRKQLVCGVGSAHPDVRGLRQSYGEALEATDLAKRKRQPLVRFDDAWFDRFLMGALSAEELAELVLAPVASLTPYRREAVLETLEAYLDSGSSIGAVAEALHLHRQSVNYRMQNVRRLFGQRLMTPNGRLALHIAVKAARLRPS
jgi:hypothetical protein